MDRLDVVAPRDGENLCDIEIRGRRRAVAEGMGDGRVADVAAGEIGFAVDRDACDVEFAQGAEDAAGDGAAIGNQDFLEHGTEFGVWAGRPAVGFWGLPRAVSRQRSWCFSVCGVGQ